MITRLYLFGLLVLLCAGNALGQELVAEFPKVEMKDDTLALIVHYDIEPTMVNYYKGKPKILTADKYDNTLVISDLSRDMRIADEYIGDYIGYMTVGRVTILIQKGLLKDIKVTYPQKKRFDIEVFKLHVPGEVTIHISDPWEWKYTIKNKQIISDSFNPTGIRNWKELLE